MNPYDSEDEKSPEGVPAGPPPKAKVPGMKVLGKRKDAPETAPKAGKAPKAPAAKRSHHGAAKAAPAAAAKGASAKPQARKGPPRQNSFTRVRTAMVKLVCEGGSEINPHALALIKAQCSRALETCQVYGGALIALG